MTAAAARLRQLLDDAPSSPLSLPASVCWFWGDKSARRLPMKRFEAQARLIALAPELALLAADMADALEQMRDRYQLIDADDHTRELSSALLARLDTLTDAAGPE